MKIEIKQKKFTFFNSQYEILINGKLTYKAKSKFYLISPKIEFYDLNNNSIGFLKEKYTFKNISETLNHKLVLPNKEVCTLNSHSFIEHNLVYKNGKIDFYEQKGNDIGIFIKEIQVGIISRNRKKKNEWRYL